MKRRGWIGLAVAVALVSAGGAVALLWPESDTGFDELRARDRSGATACMVLRDWLRGEMRDRDGKPFDSYAVEAVTAQSAAAASTVSIQALVRTNDAATPLGLPSRYVKLPELREACAAVGVAMPPYVEPR